MKLDIGGVERLATGITPYSFALAGADCTYTVADVDGITSRPVKPMAVLSNER